MCDLATVFYRLSGNQEQVPMEEVIKMFKNINIWVTKYEVKKVTNSRDWVTLDHFKSLMESQMMRKNFKNLINSKLESTKNLPVDLSWALAYLYEESDRSAFLNKIAKFR